MHADDLQSILQIQPDYIQAEEWLKYFERCLEENKSCKRITFVASYDGKIAGYVNVIYLSEYPNFAEKNIPEINDLYVGSLFRRQGVGRALVEACEKHAAGAYEFIGLGVGLYKDYGTAQKLYTEMGYILDGHGLMYKNCEVPPGRDVFVDDDLLLYLYKKLKV
jgi:GNAT superfamily N-acetyltransferase